MPLSADQIIAEGNIVGAAAQDLMALATKAREVLPVVAAAAMVQAEAARDRATQAIQEAQQAGNGQAAEDALQAARAALATATATVAPAAAQAGFGDPKDEWKECRSTIDRFDKLLVDLRKTGFGFVTTLVGAAAFIFQGSTLAVKGPVLCMLVLLIVTLYLIDRVHQAWLLETVELAQRLEARLQYRITTQIGSKFKGRDATILGILLYVVLLVITGAIFWFAIPPEEALTGGHRMIIVGALGGALLIMIVSPYFLNLTAFPYGPIREQAARHRKKVLAAAVLVLIALAAWLWHR
jgi:ElaB/YqjD/DUF883 family membrane-anchored ribosome-binding protein